MFKKTLLSAILILLPTTAFAANNNNASISQSGSSYVSSSSSSSSTHSQMEDDQKRGTKRRRTINQNANQNSQREDKNKQQKTLIKKQMITLTTPVYGIDRNNTKYKVTDHKRQIPKDTAIKHSQTIAAMLNPEVEKNYPGENFSIVGLEELTPNQLDDIANIMLQAEQDINAIPTMALKAKSIDQLLDLIAKLSFLDVSDNIFNNLGFKFHNASILENITDDQFQKKLQSDYPSINQNWKNKIIRYIKSQQTFKNVVHLKGNDGSEVVIPQIAFKYLIPSMQSPDISPLIKKSNTIELDLNGPQLEEIAHLATELVRLRYTIQEKDQKKKLDMIIDALSETPLALAPTTISQFQLINLPSNISPKSLSALQQIDMQELLNFLPVKLDEDKIDESFIKIITTLLSLRASDFIISAVARKWVKHIKQTTKTYDEKEKRLQTNIPMLTKNIAKYTNPHQQELFTYSINELLLKNQIPPIQNGQLNLSNKKIGSLDGLLNIPDIQTVTQLNLNNNQIKDIKGAFDKLTNLTHLYIYNNQIKDIKEAFDNLANLTHLRLDNNQISDIIGAFDKLTNLTDLYLFNNQIKDIKEAFDKLTNLTHLRLDNNQISDIKGAFDTLTNLTHLGLFNNQIKDIKEAFDNLANLTHLGLDNNQIKDIKEAFDNLANLTHLRLDNNQIKDIKGAFDTLTNLTFLRLDNNQISDIIGAFDTLANLTDLYLFNNQISDIKGAFDTLANLTYLGLGYNQIRDIKGAFDNLSNLTHLYLSYNQIRDIKGAFDNLSNLTHLGLLNNQIEDIKGAFSNLTNLTHLYLFNNQISDIKGAFDNLTNLRELCISKNPIKSVQNIFNNLTHLQELSIHSTNLNDSQKFDLKQTLRNTTIHFQPPQQQ